MSDLECRELLRSLIWSLHKHGKVDNNEMIGFRTKACSLAQEVHKTSDNKEDSQNVNQQIKFKIAMYVENFNDMQEANITKVDISDVKRILEGIAQLIGNDSAELNELASQVKNYLTTYGDKLQKDYQQAHFWLTKISNSLPCGVAEPSTSTNIQFPEFKEIFNDTLDWFKGSTDMGNPTRGIVKKVYDMTVQKTKYVS